jgi:hypothetical protein
MAIIGAAMGVFAGIHQPYPAASRGNPCPTAPDINSPFAATKHVVAFNDSLASPYRLSDKPKQKY